MSLVVTPRTEEIRPSKPPKNKNKRQTQAKKSNRSQFLPNTGFGASPNLEDSDQRVINWASIIWIALLHVGAIGAFFTFTWQGLVALVALHWLTGSVGICLGFHRLLTHSSFQTYRPVKWLLAFIGGLAGEGSAIDWVAHHRQHHALSDKPGDPHSPHDGPWWSHAQWLVWTRPSKAHQEFMAKWAPDLLRDPGIRWVSWMFLPSHFLMGLALFAGGYYFGGAALGTSLLVWGLFLRLVCVLHATWFVNSASHIWGYKNYETTDESRNNWWVAIIAYGEGWHNNHHAWPRMANHGHKWWEFDPTYGVVRLMRATGLAWNVVNYQRRSELD